jgi:hypothetical protein
MRETKCCVLLYFGVNWRVLRNFCTPTVVWWLDCHVAGVASACGTAVRS